ncbi:hypothetical protein CMV_023700 [Castanea mollissima]|uniref:Uncharacterized protein n=1 Tax=Castanea mollissima TaxID=60419 RepID=A0A8J4VD84_9ROSI|nr:hypothetical protein CMV_023700 [Castanea mollissima]
MVAKKGEEGNAFNLTSSATAVGKATPIEKLPILGDQDGFHAFGRRLNGFAFVDDKFVYLGHNHRFIVMNPMSSAPENMFMATRLQNYCLKCMQKSKLLQHFILH